LRRSLLQDDDGPIRGEIFGVERLEQHAQSLAATHLVRQRPTSGRRLNARLRDNNRELLNAYRSIADAIRKEQAIAPAAEWLVDNFHLIEDQIRDIRNVLSSGYFKQLPTLAQGFLEGYPRVFAITWAYVSHSDSKFDVQMLTRFLLAYQRVEPLTIWSDFFETVSPVDTFMRGHGCFAEMDSPSRDRYRHAIEELARRSNHAELDVAEMAVQLAKDATPSATDDVTTRREREPGYYLISKGRSVLEKQLGYRAPMRLRAERALTNAGMQGYLAAIASFVVFFITFPLLGLSESGIAGRDFCF